MPALRLVSADSHVNEPPEVFGERLDARWRSRALRTEIVDGVGCLVMEGMRPRKLPKGRDALTGEAVERAQAGTKRVLPFVPASHPPVASTSPPPFRNETRWRFKTKALGLQKVQVKLLPKTPGKALLTAKAKQWFSAAAANRPTAETLLTVTIGSGCSSSPVTKKID